MLTSLVKLDPIYAYFDVDDRTLLRIRRLVREGHIPSARERETPVQVGLPDEDGFSYTGVVDFIDNSLDPGTGTLRVRAVVPNAKLLLSPKQFVRVRLPIGSPRQAVLVPEEALGTDQGQKFVYVVVDAKTEHGRDGAAGGLPAGEAGPAVRPAAGGRGRGEGRRAGDRQRPPAGAARGHRHDQGAGGRTEAAGPPGRPPPSRPPNNVPRTRPMPHAPAP